uniref:Uncharacterized protein n=1 Tax=Vibrio phage Vc1 TaxID=1480731 RepID=A0A6M5C996_9CAUD
MDYRPIDFSPCPGNLQDSTTYTINGTCYAVNDLRPGEIVSVTETNQRYKDYRPIDFSPCPGNLQDSTTYTINGTCYAVNDLRPGEIVSVTETNQRYKGIGKFNGKPFGVVFLDNCNYQEGDPIPVVSKGKVFALTRMQEQPEPLQQVLLTMKGLRL